MYWNDCQPFEQALMVARKQIRKISFANVGKWAYREGAGKQYDV